MVRILTNPGANLPPRMIERFDIALTSSSIVVDGDAHDIREGCTLPEVDHWVATAREHPYVLGTSAAEFVRMYLSLGAESGTPIVVVMSSAKIIQSYDAACTAARTMRERAPGVSIEVVDSTRTDLGLGLPVLAAAKAAAAGRSSKEIVALTEAMAQTGLFAFLPRTLDNLVRGGRASFLRGWLANLLRVRPVLAFVDGEPGIASKCSSKANPADVLFEHVRGAVPPGPVWIGVSHGGVPDDAFRLAERLRAEYDVRLELIREIAATVYLHAGPRGLGVSVFPLADLPWIPPSD